MLLSCSLSSLINLISIFYPISRRDLYLHAHINLYIIWLLIAFVNVIGICGTFFWRKWGLYILIAVPILNIVFSLVYLNGLIPISIDIGLVFFVVILTWASLRKWRYFS
jgi:hypothetical protein